MRAKPRASLALQCAPNELLALLNRAIEARHRNSLDFDALAGNVVELEFLGFSGVRFLLEALQDDRVYEPHPGLRLHCAGGVWTAPSAGVSLLLHALVLIDQALWLANQHGALRFRFCGASHAPALAAEFVRAQQESWAMELRWPDPGGGGQWLMKAGARGAEPGLWLAEASEDGDGDVLFTLTEAGHSSATSVPGGFKILRGPAEFASSRQASLAGGLSIAESEWEELMRLGEGVLVESSEASRRGAGE